LQIGAERERMIEQYQISQQEVKRLQAKLEAELVEKAGLSARVAAAEAAKSEMATKVEMAQATAKVWLAPHARTHHACTPARLHASRLHAPSCLPFFDTQEWKEMLRDMQKW